MLIEAKRLINILLIFKKHKLFTTFNLLKNNKLEQANFKNIRLACEDLGALFIKLGQLLSTRHDILPSKLIDELSQLQDKVKPFECRIAKQIIKQELGLNVNEIFDDFSSKPLAAASVAQVYSARLKKDINNGDDSQVIIKILRPELNKQVSKDLKVMRMLAKILPSIYPELSRFKLDELLLELERVLFDEQDLLREAANASQLRRNFINCHILYIPKIYWQYCTKKVLVTERISGINVTDIEELKRAGVDLQLLSKRGVELFFTQVFEHCLFHGDLHPGNIFVNATNPADPGFYTIDFGIMGTLGEKEQYYLAYNLLAFLERDYREIARLHIESNWVDPDTRIDLFEAAIRTVSEPILSKPMAEISFGQLFLRLFEVGKSFNMQLQPQLLVFKKSLINIEGIAKKLNPELNLWEASRPHVEKWMRNRLGVKGFLNQGRLNFAKWSQYLIEYPELLHTFLVNKVNNHHPIHSSNLTNKKPLKFNKIIAILLFILSFIMLSLNNYEHFLSFYQQNKNITINSLSIMLFLIGLFSYFKQRNI